MSREKTAGKTLAAMRKRVLEWYGLHKRAMPWRGTRDAYRVWVSEVMLQQTRVAAVEPYYRRFVRRFPTLRALARARSEEVLRLWAGLGYYSRARNLHRAAREMVAKHGGKFPREVGQALALPGVGRYTAAAVLSIAYGKPLAVVDGNVARVVARLEAVRGELREAGTWRKLESKAQELMGESGECRVALRLRSGQASGEAGKQEEVRKRGSEEGKKTEAHGRRRADLKAIPAAQRKAKSAASSAPTKEAQQATRKARREQAPAFHVKAGEWNQAMMELGATVCTPRAPRCEECPVAKWCRARKLGLEEKIPAARKKRAAEKMEIAAAVLVDARGRTLLVKPEKAETNGLFSGMWQFPAVEMKRVASGEWPFDFAQGKRVASEKLNLLEPQIHAEKRGYEIKRGKDLTQRKQRSTEGTESFDKGRGWVELAAIKHSVTYREITLRPFVVRVRALPAMKGGRAVPLARVGAMAVSSATRKIARAAEKGSGVRGQGRSLRQKGCRPEGRRYREILRAARIAALRMTTRG